MKRKKRLVKGIESLQKQIEIHEGKMRIAEEDDNLDLMDYYDKEIKAIKNEKQMKQDILDK